MIEINSYNPNKDVFLSTTFIMEQNNVGYVFRGHQVCVINFLNDLSMFLHFNFGANLIFNMCFYVLIIGYSVYNIMDIIKEVKKKGLKFFYEFWNIIKFFKILLYVTCFIMRMTLYITFSTQLTKLADYYDTSEVCQIHEALGVLEMVMICLTLIYFLYYLDENIVGPIFNTLFQSLRAILTFILSYVFTILGYAIFCNYVFGIYLISKIFEYNQIYRV
jgi:hypothetical protein